MMIVEFQKEHFERIQLQAQQIWLKEYIKPEQFEGTECYTILDGEKVVAIGGIAEIWEGRATIWGFLCADMKKYMLFCHKAVENFLRLCVSFNRIECVVDVDFGNGHRWMKLLGFKKEGIMRKYSPNGEDVVSYAKVKE